MMMYNCQYINVDSECPSVRHGHDSEWRVSFPRFELRTGYVNGTRAPQIFRSVQLALSTSDPLTQTNANSNSNS